MPTETNPTRHATALRVSLILLAATVALPLGLVALIGSGLAATLNTSRTGPDTLNIDAIPAHARHLATWVIRAGTICDDLTPPMIAAQIEVESNWRTDAVAHNPPQRGGDAIGIAQFQLGTWQHWGDDHDQDGHHGPDDPEDAIYTMGTLMCDHTAWAARNLATGILHGNPHDLAWAAYHCGRACVRDAGGVPAAGRTHDYPQRVRTRIPAYTHTIAAGTGTWRLPLPAGSYRLVSGFRPPQRPTHDGIDLAAPTGTPIYAAAAGTVFDAGCTSPYCDRPGNPQLPGCGLRININHGNGLATRYCHAVRLNVQPGAQVHAGQLIAWVGSTGHSSGPHLHFEIHHNAPPLTSDNATNPIPILRSHGIKV